jgi:hypothetical protein
MEWKDFEAVIPAVMSMPGRADSVRELLKDLAKQCPGIKVHVMPQWYDKIPNWRDVFITISRSLQNVTSPWVLYFEDDAQLAPDFGERALPIINNVDGYCGAVAFFSSRCRDLEQFRDGISLYEPELPFIFTQGMAIRKEVVEAWSNNMVEWWDKAKKKYQKKAPDMALGHACYQAGYKILVHLPSLVQHRQLLSAYGHTYYPHSTTFGR